MNFSIIKWLLIAALLIGLIAGASVLYNNLDKDMSGNLVTESPKDSEGDKTTVEDTSGTESADPQTSTPVSDTDTETDEVEEDTGKVEENNKLQPQHDFNVVDANGKAVLFSDLLGKPIVLNFWATWCGWCEREMPDFEEMYKKYGEDVTFVMVNVTGGSETVEKAKQFIADEGYTFPVYFDVNRSAATKYGTDAGIPMSYFFDAQGTLIAHAEGAIDAATLEIGIGMITEE